MSIPTTITPQASILSLPVAAEGYTRIDIRFLAKAKENVEDGSIVTPAGIPANIYHAGMKVVLVPAASEGVRPFCGVLKKVVTGSDTWIAFMLDADVGPSCLFMVPRPYARLGLKDRCKIAIAPNKWLDVFPPLIAVYHPQPTPFEVEVEMACIPDYKRPTADPFPWTAVMKPGERTLVHTHLQKIHTYMHEASRAIL
ncbi:hypothetical protein DAEQUDRAFT_742159 [Daedalea quercina L-15889]|uniref:Uncharacterized protein n=1 Tax=Daedalea quercina L-15889 TaxID=1314783 RepID=A0A165KE98_9APHY|nr:hypothetical protein DAEQUDRAFT_742159 [Daedalea quercina L-15889]